jgi:hypothetical protein
MASSTIMIRAAFAAGLLAAAAAANASQDNVAVVRALSNDLLIHDSATEVLRRWCADHRLADPPVIKAERDHGIDKPADLEVRARLRAAPGELVRYRHVRLACGGHILSEADNWYLPALLTPDMNRQLDQTDRPFGVVARPLAFHRHTLKAVQLLTDPGARSVPHAVLRHEAVLTTAAGRPFSLVIETYTSEVLGLSPPGR